MENELHQLIKFLKESTTPQKASVTEVKKPDLNISSLIEDLQTSIHSDVLPKKKTSKGFDVQKFEFLMRSKLIDEYKKLQSFDRPYISVSELCSCTRKSYYERKRYEVDINEMFKFPYLALLQEVGTFVHKFIQSIYGFTENEKSIISEKYKTKGRLDSIQDNVLVEFKTIDSADFENKYSERDYHQCLVYVYILNTEYNYKIESITIVYVLRSFKRVVPFDLDVNDKLAKSLLERAPLLLSCIEKGEVAEPTGAVIGECEYCLYRKFCEKDRSFVQKPYETGAKKENITGVKKEIPVTKNDIPDSKEAVFLI